MERSASAGGSHIRNGLTMALGVAILGIGLDQILNGGLRDDNSFMGLLVKGVLLAVGLAFVLLPLRAMLSSRDEQRLYVRSLGRGLRRSALTLGQELGSLSATARTVGRTVAVAGARGFSSPD